MESRTKRLALRVTRNSALMILGVYIILQVLAYFRDNLIFGLSDLSALPASVLGFVGVYVLPPLVVFSALIYAKALPIQKVALRLEAGEALDADLIELTRLRILRFSRLILVLNIVGFTLGSILLVVLAGNYHEFLEFDRLVIIASNLAGSIVYASAQTALNNVAFAPVRDRLGIREIGARKREMSTAKRQVFLTALVAFYALSFLQFNNRDILLAARIETEALGALREERITRDGLPAEYRRILAERLPAISTRAGLDAETLPLPWEAGIDYPRVQRATFALFGLFMAAMALFVQACVSRDLGSQIRGLARRLRDLLEGGGDLRVRINLQAMDDLGELTELQNRLLDTFHGIALRIGEAAAQTREGAAAIDRGLAEAERASGRAGEAVQALEADLVARAEESRGLGESLGSFREAASRVNQAADDQRRVVSATQTAMAEMAASIREVEDMTGRAGGLSGDLAARGSEGGEAMAGTRAAIDAIEEASRGVLEVLGSLGKIASNINLLAMNAAIEAAHAGQHGLGFAVVADEVRSLAATATKETKAIKALIATMTDRIGEGVRRAETSGAVLDRLVVGLGESADISREIALSSRRQGEGTRAVEASLGEVVASCEAIGRRMAEQARATETMAATLGTAMSRLEGLASGSRAQSESMRELEASFRTVRQEVDRNLAAVDALGAEVGRFKV